MTLRTGYGTGLFTAGKYGLPQVFEGAVSASISAGVTADAERIKIGSVSDAIAVTTSATAIRIQNGVVSDSISASVVVAGYTTIVGAVDDRITSDFDLYWNRVRPFAVNDHAKVGVSVNARYKWLDASDPTTTWAKADYLERAA